MTKVFRIAYKSERTLPNQRPVVHSDFRIRQLGKDWTRPEEKLRARGGSHRFTSYLEYARQHEVTKDESLGILAPQTETGKGEVASRRQL